ncbi:MAG: amidohydrolase [Desulfobacterales bacterium]|jgi:amidohydrolase
MNISPEVLAINHEVVALRRHFHQNPELGDEEFQTAEKIADYLHQHHLEVKTGVNKTGVVGLLRGSEKGPTLMLRADMDALPIKEECDVPYRSRINGKMHACGHDGHMAILLGAAKILSRRRENLRGNIKFVFQPNEENGGALAMIEDGVLENPTVDASLGIHLWSPIETGKIAVNAGPVMAGMYYFRITIIGQGGHTATPQGSVDPIITAAEVVQALQTIQTRELDVLTPTSIVFGEIQGGTAWNIIPDKVKLSGTMRFLYEDTENGKEELPERFERILAGVCRAHRTEYELSMVYGHPALVNDQGMTELVRSAAQKVLDTPRHIVSFVSMAGEDFAEFADRVPSAFYFVGTGNEKKATCFPHHHPRFNIDEDSLKIGLEMVVRTVFKFFSNFRV